MLAGTLSARLLLACLYLHRFTIQLSQAQESIIASQLFKIYVSVNNLTQCKKPGMDIKQLATLFKGD